MIKSKCINHQILEVLANCGHGDKLLITDGNFAIDSNVHPNTKKIYLNLTHGIPLVTDVLKVIMETVNIEKVETMLPQNGSEPEIFSSFRETLGPEYELFPIVKPDFYKECEKSKVRLAILTGDQRTFGNILLTVGVVQMV